MKLKTLLVASAAVVAFGGVDALAGGSMGAGEKGRHAKHSKHHKKHGKSDKAKADAKPSGLWKSGFTAGAMIGWQHLNPKKTTLEEFEIPGQNAATPPFKVKMKKSNAIVGGPFVGYNYFLKNILLGAQTGVDFNSGKSKKNFNFPAEAHFGNLPGSLELKKRWSLLIHAKIGMAMGKILPYVKLGVAINKYRIKEQAPTRNYRENWHKTATHFAPAIGVDYAVNKNISVGIEAMHEFRKKITTKTKSATKVRSKPHITTVKAGVAWRM